MIERARWDDISGFELCLAPSSEDSERFTLGPVREISRRSALRTLRTFGLAPDSLSLLSRGPFIREGGGGTGAGAARIEVVRLASRRTLRVFDTIRSRDPNVSESYSDLERKGFAPVLDRARGTVMRAYSADGVARGGGIVVELAHERSDGAIAWFHVSARERMGDGSATLEEVSADYTVRLGHRVETCAAGDGRGTRAVAVKGRAS